MAIKLVSSPAYAIGRPQPQLGGGGTIVPTGQPKRWYPTTTQLKDPDSLERSFRQVLNQHYALQDRYNTLLDAHTSLQQAHDDLQSQVNQPGPPPGSGPVDTQLLGLRVAPVDVKSLPNGATLQWNSASGMFEFV